MLGGQLGKLFAKMGSLKMEPVPAKSTRKVRMMKSPRKTTNKVDRPKVFINNEPVDS